jgi:hypothetical protein
MRDVSFWLQIVRWVYFALQTVSLREVLFWQGFS